MVLIHYHNSFSLPFIVIKCFYLVAMRTSIVRIIEPWCFLISIYLISKVFFYSIKLLLWWRLLVFLTFFILHWLFATIECLELSFILNWSNLIKEEVINTRLLRVWLYSLCYSVISFFLQLHFIFCFIFIILYLCHVNDLFMFRRQNSVH
jgi:hypothetical protein